MRIKTTRNAWKKVLALALALLISLTLVPNFSKVIKADTPEVQGRTGSGTMADPYVITVTAANPAKIPKNTGSERPVYLIKTNGEINMGSQADTGVNKCGIYVEPGFKGTIILDNVNIKTSSGGARGSAPMMVDGGGDNTFENITTEVLLLLKGNNNLTTTGANAAALEVWRGAKILVDDYNLYTQNSSSQQATLTCNASTGGAGIGTGNRPYSGGHMIFRGGIITASSPNHAAGIGDAWGNSMKPANEVPRSFAQHCANSDSCSQANNRKYLWNGTIVIYDVAEVTSNGGNHGAGIGGGCYATGVAVSTPGKLTSSILVVPRGDTVSAKSDSGRKDLHLGAVGNGQRIYLGDVNQDEIKVSTSDGRADAAVYLNIEDLDWANEAVLKLADRIPGQISRNLYPDMVYFGKTGAQTTDGEGNKRAWAIRSGEATARLQFYTTATTPGTNLNYDRADLYVYKTNENGEFIDSNGAVIDMGSDAFVSKLVPIDPADKFAILNYPSYAMELKVTPSTGDLGQGYSQKMSDDVAATATVKNTSESVLNDVILSVADSGDFFEIIYNKPVDKGGGVIEHEVVRAKSVTIAEIKSGEEVTVKIPLKTSHTAKDEAYKGMVSVSVSSIGLGGTPDAVEVSQKVAARTLNAKIALKDGSNVVNKNPFWVTAEFDHPVSAFTATGIRADRGTVVAGTITPTDTAVDGRHKTWEFQVKPDSDLETNENLYIQIKAGATTDDHNTKNAASNILLPSISDDSPILKFLFEENEILTVKTDDVSINIEGNGTGTDFNQVFTNGGSLISSTNVASGISVYRYVNDQKTLISSVSFEVDANNNIKIKPSGGFTEGKYNIEIKSDYFKNNLGNFLMDASRDFEVRIPVVDASPAGITVSPTAMPYTAGKATLTVKGQNFQFLKPDQLQIELPKTIIDEKGNEVTTDNYRVEPSKISDDGTTATYEITIPINKKDVSVSYDFKCYLNDVYQDQATTTVSSADTGWNVEGAGLKVSPNETDYEAKTIDIKIKGENLHHYNDLEVWVYHADDATTPIGKVPCDTDEAGVVTIKAEYPMIVNLENRQIIWTYKLANNNVLIPEAGQDTVKQGPATPGIHEFRVCQDPDGKGSIELVLDDAGGVVYFNLEGLHLHNKTPISILNDGQDTSNEIIPDGDLMYNNTNTKVKLDPNKGFTIPPNKTQQDIVYTFWTTKLDGSTPTGHKVRITVKKPAIGVDSLSVDPDVHNVDGGDSVFTLTGRHMDVATLELRDQDRSGFKYTLDSSMITNNGSDAEITINMPEHSGAARNDIYYIEAYFDGKATGHVVKVEVGPSTASITHGSADPNHFKSADDTLDGRGRSELKVHGHYLYNYDTIKIYDRLYDRYYDVDISGKDQEASVMVNVPSAKGVYYYDIYANGVKTEHVIQVNVGISLGQSGDMEGSDDASGSGGAGIKYEEFVGAGGGSKGKGYNGAYEEGFDLLKYQSERSSYHDPRNPSVSIRNREFISREQLDLAASGAKLGMLKSDKSGVVYAERNKLGILTLLLDTTSEESDKVLEGRIYLTLDKPLEGIYSGVHTRDDFTKATTKKFKDRYANKNIWVVHLVQNGSYGTDVEIAAKLDIEKKTNDYDLYFYRMDRKTGKFRQIEDPNHYFDTSGYLHFTTNIGGDIIISDKPLVQEGKIVTSGEFPVNKTNQPAVEEKE